MQNLAQELETEINQHFCRWALPSHPAARQPRFRGVKTPRTFLDREERSGSGPPGMLSNQNSLVSLAHNGCDLAGMHLPQGELRTRSIDACKGWLKPGVHRVVSFVTREMGLMVKPGNPLRIVSPAHLLDPSVRFVNRDPDSGTRLLFDQILDQQKLDGSAINGYEQVEFTHAAVAAYVASGMADVGFGVEAAARQFHLDFVRLVTEDYFFVCRKQLLDTEAMKRVLVIMRGEEFQTAISRLPGYRCSDAGEVKTVSLVFQNSAKASRQIRPVH